ncbi:ATP-binding protein [Seonamhaeicola sp.]|uniref:ATP-binding response regulator n=1 Tax=Seonamhaeicola sp. TaxID=1912245 RepID=UPI002633C1BB|nr:ATP-binding protein [Seonamhaeicola sp.]
MKTRILTYFLAFTAMAYSQQSERDIVNKIDSINSEALSYYGKNQIVQSFKEFNKAKKLSDSIDDSYGKAIACFNLGNIYNLMQEYENAEHSYIEMLEASKKTDDNSLIAKAFLSLGEFEKKINPPHVALDHLEKALAHISKDDYLGKNDYDKSLYESILLKTRINLCELYLETGDLDQAYLNLLRIGDRVNDKTDLESYYIKGHFNYLYGLYYVEKELYNSASQKFELAVTILKQKSLENKDEVNLLLAKAYKQFSLSLAEGNNEEEAYQALLKHNQYQNKFINEKRINYEVITRSKLLIEDYKNDAQIAKTEKALLLQRADDIKTINLVITIALVLLAITLILLYKGYASKRKLNTVLGEQNSLLEFARNEAVKSSELKSKFISNVTHELRTPLYGVVGITSLLLKNNNLSACDNKLLESLKYSGDYLLNLINDVLQFGKIESEKLELKHISVNLRELIKNNVNSFNYRLQETNNKIITSIDENVPNYIKCDSVRLSQVLINLIGNSIKFTESGYIHVRIKTLNLSEDNVALHFEVEDEGKGIPEEKFNTIFENFQQLDDENNTNYQGTGLGLSITKKIVELFGSEIELESEVGVGTKISFDITFDIDHDQKCQEELDESSGKLVDLKEKYEILIAEDNKINQIVTKNLLSKQNYNCEIVENGLEAIKALEEKSFDLILMDINMPVMDGIEATKMIRKSDAKIPVLALTAADIEYVKENYDDIGFTGILTKPFDNDEFFQMIETSIQRSKKYGNGLERVS